MFQERRGAAAKAEALQQPQDAENPVLPKRARRSLKAVAVEARGEPAPAPTPVQPTAPQQSPPPPAPAGEAKADAEFAPPRRRHLRKLVVLLGIVAALAAAAWYGNYWWTTGRFFISTDDAYVGAKSSTIATKVSGYVSAVAVEDNAHVKAGEPIVRIDDGDYQLAVQTAKDTIGTQQATINRIEKQIAAQKAAVDQAKAELSSVQAGQTRAELELARQQALAAHNYASHQSLEQAQAARDQSIAAVKGAEAGVEAALTNGDVLRAQQEEAKQTLRQLQTALAKAERDLSFTIIRAPFDGVMGNRAVQTGDYVESGQRLATLVPLNAVYIDANFKETQLGKLKPGQPVSIAVDALRGHKVAGTVVSVAPASGSVFSLLPPDNATGNFTKIVQRVPVRIEVPVDVAQKELLRPGMSVVVSVNTKADAAEPAAASAIATSASAGTHAAPQP